MKLANYGIRGITNEWFKSYLSDGRHTVSVNSAKSEQCNVTCGVPQGSVLLFLIYINDFQNSSDLFDFHLFADESNLFCEHKNISNLEKTINNELCKVHTWLCANRLSLNIDKSNFVIFHPPQKNVQGLKLNLKINDQQLNREFFIKYLGVMIDSNLNWKKHAESVVKKIRRSVGILSKIRYYVSTEILMTLYYALVYPFIMYGLIVWGNTYETTIKPVFVIQKRAVRVITFSNFDQHSSPFFKALKIVKFPDLVTYLIAIYMYKFHNQLLPGVFASFFTKVHTVHSYNTRHSAKLTYYLPKARTNYGKFSIRFQGPKIWNASDDETKKLSMSLFKKRSKQGFIEAY